MNVILGANLAGPAGTATEVIVSGDRPTPDQTATLACWFLDCPGQSPAWRHYLLSIIHLRPIEVVRPAHIRVPGATHEVLLVAVDPQANPDPLDPETWHILTPANVEQQVELPDDEDATLLLERCARAVVAGVLPAEPMLAGAVEPWRTALIKSAAHFRGEVHAP